MQASLLRNGEYLQRRKMYPVRHRHNLRSNVDLYWLKTKQSGDVSNSRILRQKMQMANKEGRENYNKYINKKYQQQYPKQSLPDLYLSPQQHTPSSYNPNKKNINLTDQNLNRNDDSLSRQLQNFKNNSSISVSQNPSIQPYPMKVNLNCHERKLKNLRSSLDKPVLFENSQSIPGKQALRNYDKDKLQNFLRPGEYKKSSRYY